MLPGRGGGEEEEGAGGWLWSEGGQRVLALLAHMPGLPHVLLALLAAAGGNIDKKACEWLAAAGRREGVPCSLLRLPGQDGGGGWAAHR